MRKNMILGMLVTMLLSFCIQEQAFASVESMNKDLCIESIENKSMLRAEIYEWRYKIENGKLYKRLFNCTRGEWAGDWILIE